MRSVMPQPCIGSSCSAFSTSRSSVPWSRSPLSFPTPFLSIDERKSKSVPFDRQGEDGRPAQGPLRQSGQRRAGLPQLGGDGAVQRESGRRNLAVFLVV